MLLTAIALIAQTSGLTAERFEAAKICATATAVAQARTKTRIRLTSQLMFYLMHAARAKPGDKLFAARLEELAKELQSATPPALAEASALVAQCEARFPRPAATRPENLPADPFRRDLMCLANLSLLQGAAEQVKKDDGDPRPLEQINAVLNPLLGTMNDTALATRGITSEAQFMQLFNESLSASIAIGEPASVAVACGVKSI